MDIKQKPEDFQVKEVISLKLDDKGPYAYALLKKKNYNTLDALKQISKALKIGLKKIGYAGSKDRRAVTFQYISLPKISREKINNLNLKDISLKFKGYGSKRIVLGDVIENKFKIKFPYEFKKTDFCENYFDEQRFGISSDNHELGRLIVKKDFNKLNSLVEKTENHELNLKLRFYFHSYQSYLFNLCLAELMSKYQICKVNYSLGSFVFIKKKIKNFKIPLLNFDTVLKGDIGKVYKNIMKKENIILKDFLVKQYPFLVSDTQYRDAFFKVKNLKKKGNFIYFILPKGSYATILIKKLLNT
ncbi:MAG: tRNA pseudouridine(13) synthase TruD [Nanoarchaeota archaeon]